MREDDPRRTEARIDLLLVAADPGEAARLRDMLESSDAPRFQVSEASDIDEALRILHERALDAMLLDLTLPEGGDLDMLMRARVAAADTPIVVLAAEDHEDDVIEALRAGAQDYLTREECSPSRLSRAIHQAVERHGIRAELQAARNREHFFATHDGLTGLPNRESFLHKIPSALAQARPGETAGGRRSSSSIWITSRPSTIPSDTPRETSC
jgi:PleD family two-component response regulator